MAKVELGHEIIAKEQITSSEKTFTYKVTRRSKRTANSDSSSPQT